MPVCPNVTHAVDLISVRPMTTRPSRLDWISLWVAVGWVGVSWFGRLRNIAVTADHWRDELGSLLMSVTFVTLALAVVVTVLWWQTQSRRSEAMPSIMPLAVALGALAVVSVVVWAIRIVDIAFMSSHEVSFIIVHVVLAVLGIGTSVWAATNFWKRAKN